MKRGEKITIERLQTGLYCITLPGGNTILVGGAASTAIRLNSAVFFTEASELPSEEK